MPLSTFLNGRAPTTLRGLQWLALSDTGVIVTRTYTSDSGGGGTATWTTGGTVACRIDPLGERGQSRPTGGRIDERSTHMVTVPVGSTVAADDRFQITGRGTFEVTATRERTAEPVQVFEVVEVL